MRIVLEALSKAKRNPIGEAWVPSEKLSNDINLEPADLNDAIELLHEQGLVKCLQVPDYCPWTTYPAKKYNITKTHTRRPL